MKDEIPAANQIPRILTLTLTLTLLLFLDGQPRIFDIESPQKGARVTRFEGSLLSSGNSGLWGAEQGVSFGEPHRHRGQAQ